MNPIVRNILAVIGGIVVGSVVNMSLINIGHKIILPPPGVDLSSMEGLKQAMPLFGPEQFIFPFLAHSLGAFAGALVAAFAAVSHKMKFALGLGGWFMLGGIAAIFMLPSPMWYTAIDLVLAYIPFAYLAGKIATKKSAAPSA